LHQTLLLFFAIAISPRASWLHWIAFSGSEWWLRPWTLFTWPLAAAYHPINLIFACAWAFSFCGSVERSWSSQRFITFMAGTAAITALALDFGSRALGSPAVLAGLWPSIAAPTIAWTVINRREKICFWGATIPAPILAVIVLVIVWYDEGAPIRGLFALSGCAAAYAYTTYGRSFGYRDRTTYRRTSAPHLRIIEIEQDFPRNASPLLRLNPLRYLKAWKERKALEKLWNRSNGTDRRD